jgi:hypothetical protein
VATTSTKAPGALKTDIRRVLDRMQVQYRETKTGFDCIHLPSIDISSLQDPHMFSAPTSRKHRKQGSGGSGDSGGTTRRIVRKASKLSFGMGRKDKDKDKDKDRAETSVNGNTHKEREREREVPGRPSGGAGSAALSAGQSGQSSGSSSFFNVSSSNAPTAHADDNNSASLHPADDSPRRSHSPARSKNLPPIPRDLVGAVAAPQPFPTGEVDREVLESVGQNTLSVRFEINIVKVRFISPSSSFQFFFCGFSDANLGFPLLLGAMVAITWYPIPSREWGWMAVSDARTTSVDGIEALTCTAGWTSLVSHIPHTCSKRLMLFMPCSLSPLHAMEMTYTIMLTPHFS